MIHNILPGNRIQRNQKLLNKFPESYLRYLARLWWRLPSSQRGIPTNNSDLPFFFSGGNGFIFKTGVLKGVCLISGRIFVGIFTVSIISPKAVLGLPPGKCLNLLATGVTWSRIGFFPVFRLNYSEQLFISSTFLLSWMSFGRIAFTFSRASFSFCVPSLGVLCK